MPNSVSFRIEAIFGTVHFSLLLIMMSREKKQIRNRADDSKVVSHSVISVYRQLRPPMFTELIAKVRCYKVVNNFHSAALLVEKLEGSKSYVFQRLK